MPALYSYRIHDIATVARGCGYCIAVHGSMQRDLDLVAIPWVLRATSPRWLVKQLCDELGCKTHADVVRKPHGRIAYTLLMGGACFMDLSILPRRRSA